MKKTFAAFVAVATIAGSLAATPASAQRGVAAGVVGGLIGGAIIGGAIASSRPAYGGTGLCGRGAPGLPPGSRALLGRLRLAPTAASRSATDLTDRRAAARFEFETRPDLRPGFFFGRSHACVSAPS